MSEQLHEYDAYYNNRHDVVHAPSLYAAKLAAVALFKPRKRDEHMVSVVLRKLADGREVSIFQSNADLG